MVPALALAEPVVGSIGLRVCAVIAIASMTVFAASLLPRGIIEAWKPTPAQLGLVRITAACAGVAAYVIGAVGASALPNEGFALLASTPIGIAVSCSACLLWLQTSLSSYAKKQTFSFVTTANQALAVSSGAVVDNDRNPFYTSTAKAFDESRYARLLFERGAACVGGFVVGIAATLVPPAPTGIIPLALAIACPAACLTVLAAYEICAIGVLRLHEKAVDGIRTDVDRKLDVARAEHAAHTAKVMAAEAKRAAKEADRKAIEAKTKPAFEKACTLAKNEFGLSPREFEVLKQLAMGRTRPRIAEDMHLSLSTVNTHVQNIYQKLGVHKNQEMLDILESLSDPSPTQGIGLLPQRQA